MNKRMLQYFTFLFFIFTTTLRSAGLQCTVTDAPPSLEWSSYIKNETNTDVNFEIPGAQPHRIEAGKTLKIPLKSSGGIHFYTIEKDGIKSRESALLPKIVVTVTSSPSSSSSPSPVLEQE